MRHFTTIFTTIAIVSMLTISALPALAAGHPVMTTVDQAKASGVDTDVRLDGHLIKHINDNKYLFDDGTGELLVYIDNADQQKLVGSQHKVEVKGSIIRNFMYTEVQAKSVCALD